LKNSAASKILRSRSVGLGMPHIGCQVPDSKRSNGSGKLGEWLKPWVKVLKLLNLVASHACGAIALAYVWWLVGDIIDNISGRQQSWKIGTLDITLSEVTHYADFGILAVFVVVLMVDLYRWALRS
jgi:hypothetical protein